MRELSKDDILEMLKHGKSVKKDIAQHYGCSDWRIYAALKEWGIDVSTYKTFKLMPEQAEMIRQKRNDGLTFTAIAREYRVSFNTLSSFCKSHGIETARKAAALVTPEMAAEMIRLHSVEHWTQKRIGEKFGFTQATVSHNLTKHGYRCMNREPRAK